MKRSNTETHKFDYLKALHIIFFATMMISCLLNNSLAQADSLIPSDYRLATAGVKFSDTVQFAVALKFRPPDGSGQNEWNWWSVRSLLLKRAGYLSH